ncbi:MAG: type toxin-antitoxin system RelE/ParE family toxin [Devosia sp.]|uniref:type II toxin-antitoxin system RelE/ParE family toxin n=1 Tax=Devosia sp. TaxID=1871048 RepID=UPI002625D020|nr:type II toxin-antitoxin system RelE/ParE family toxin [Devosia sp.]MDB5586475.1 type toxin-antitoxin system RelE/ParE family toxin [Devosia sp.]
MRAIYTPASLRDLKSIGDFIARDNSKRAKSFVAELRTSCRSLLSDSLRCPLQERWPGIRRMPVGNYLVLYLVLYRVLDDAVQIVRVLHSARDVDDLTH